MVLSVFELTTGVIISSIFRLPRDVIIASPRLPIGSVNLDLRLYAVSEHQIRSIVVYTWNWHCIWSKISHSRFFQRNTVLGILNKIP